MKYIFRKPRAVILNDTRRDSNHLGCHLVMKNLQDLCARNGINVIGTIQSKERPRNDDFVTTFLERISRADIVILNGEGSLHHDRGVGLLEQVDLAVQKKKKAFLVNSVWEENPRSKQYLGLFKLSAFRETTSLSIAKADGACGALNVPDLSLYSCFETSHQRTEKIMFTDSVIPDVSKTLEDTAEELQVPLFPMSEQTDNMLTVAAISNAAVVVGGRFHALCLCLSTGTPMLSIESNTHKISALLSDLGVENQKYMFKDAESVCSSSVLAFKQMDHSEFLSNAFDYTVKARAKMEQMFSQIRSLA